MDNAPAPSPQPRASSPEPQPALRSLPPSYYTGPFMQRSAYNSFRFWFWYRT
jgi:hypothetical protein